MLSSLARWTGAGVTAQKHMLQKHMLRQVRILVANSIATANTRLDRQLHTSCHDRLLDELLFMCLRDSYLVVCVARLGYANLPGASCHGCPAARECTQKRLCRCATPLGDLGVGDVTV